MAGNRKTGCLHCFPTLTVCREQRRPAARNQRRTPARRTGGEIQRANETRRAFDEHQRLALVPGVVAERDRVGAGVDQVVVDRLGDAEAAGGVLAVGDDEVELPVAHQTRQPLQHDGAPRTPDDVANEENAHELMPAKIDHLALR
jgi:hypothetical protein